MMYLRYFGQDLVSKKNSAVILHMSVSQSGRLKTNPAADGKNVFNAHRRRPIASWDTNETKQEYEIKWWNTEGLAKIYKDFY